MHILHIHPGTQYPCTNINEYVLEGRDFAKGVIDIQKQEIIIGTNMHADAEQMFLENESKQEDLRGINLYPASYGTDDFIEFDSLINIRPRQNNRSRYVENIHTRETITNIVLSYFHS